MIKQRILITEDDRLSAEYLKDLLEEAKYQVIAIASKGSESIELCKIHKPDLVLMDILLKDNVSGTEAAIEINQKNSDIAIIFLTAHAKEEMIEYATRSDACAYLMKPYRDEEILATIRVVLSKRKKAQLTKSNIIKLKDNYLFDLEKSILTKDNKQILLTPTKSKLIECLVLNINTTVSNRQICNHIWDTNKEDSTLRSLVFRTKQTISEELIINVNGVGYCINSS